AGQRRVRVRWEGRPATAGVLRSRARVGPSLGRFEVVEGDRVWNRFRECAARLRISARVWPECPARSPQTRTQFLIPKSRALRCKRSQSMTRLAMAALVCALALTISVSAAAPFEVQI